MKHKITWMVFPTKIDAYEESRQLSEAPSFENFRATLVAVGNLWQTELRTKRIPHVEGERVLSVGWFSAQTRKGAAPEIMSEKRYAYLESGRVVEYDYPDSWNVT